MTPKGSLRGLSYRATSKLELAKGGSTYLLIGSCFLWGKNGDSQAYATSMSSTPPPFPRTSLSPGPSPNRKVEPTLKCLRGLFPFCQLCRANRSIPDLTCLVPSRYGSDSNHVVLLMKIPQKLHWSICDAILSKAQARSSSGLAAAAFYPRPERVRHEVHPSTESSAPSSQPRCRSRSSDLKSTSAYQTRKNSRTGRDSRVDLEAVASLYLPNTDSEILPHGPSSMGPHRPAVRSSGFFSSPTISSLTRQLSGSPPPSRSKEALLSLVGVYDEESAQEHFDFLKDVYRRGYAPAHGPNIVVSDKKYDYKFPRPSETFAASGEHAATVQKLRSLMYLAWTKPDLFSIEEAYEVYCMLPEPKMMYLTANLRHSLMHNMIESPKKTHRGMLRYFALISDIKGAGLSLSTCEWNTAISYAGRYVGHTTETEVDAVLHLWREMEKNTQIQSDAVVFNVLFDVASKAGNFVLAEMIYGEMISRGFEFNRYHYVSLIHYFGLKLDSGGVRAAYREMVEEGEMIDTTVLNCVVAGLLRCGEEGDAEMIYEKMKGTTPTIASIPDRNYFTKRVVTKVLMMQARVAERNEHMQSTLQGQTSICPDLQTYRILINHWAEKMGDLPRVVRYIDEMNNFAIPMHGAIFQALFKGFEGHGGYSGTEWSAERLDSIYDAFIRHVGCGDQGLYVGYWMAATIVKAFAKCTGSRSRLIDVYSELRVRWDLNEMEKQFLEGVLHKALKFYCG